MRPFSLLAVLVVLPLLGACGSGATPADAVVLRIGPAATIAGMNVTLGAPDPTSMTTVSHTMTFDPPSGPFWQPWQPSTLQVDVSHGKVAVAPADAAIGSTLSIPAEIQVRVLDAGGFEVRVRCDDAFDYVGAGGPAIVSGSEEAVAMLSRKGASRHCNVDLRRGGGNTRYRFAAFGDGVVLGDKIFGESLEIEPVVEP